MFFCIHQAAVNKRMIVVIMLLSEVIEKATAKDVQMIAKCDLIYANISFLF